MMDAGRCQAQYQHGPISLRKFAGTSSAEGWSELDRPQSARSEVVLLRKHGAAGTMGPHASGRSHRPGERRNFPMADLMEAITSLAKRRGIVFQSSEIYGGLRSSWDYGPLGVELKRNVKNAWWRSMVQLRDDVVGLEAAIIMSPKVWEASGHVGGFSDPLVECLDCHQRFRLDHLPGYEPGKDVSEPRCPNDGGTLMEPRHFNLMFKTFLGPVDDESS